MRIGAVIVAAGMSRRMKDFKQMMRIGDLSMAEHVVLNFQRSGIDEIVMVTGFQAEQLEKSLNRYKITFLRNEKYETTQMFDSVKIGLKYLQGKCNKILFCPVDIPLFTQDTVAQLLNAKGKVIIPKFNDEPGHPIRIDSDLINDILKYEGNKGLRGALEELPVQQTEICIDDAGTIHDADTQSDYYDLLKIYNERIEEKKDESWNIWGNTVWFDESKMDSILM